MYVEPPSRAGPSTRPARSCGGRRRTSGTCHSPRPIRTPICANPRYRESEYRKSRMFIDPSIPSMKAVWRCVIHGMPRRNPLFLARQTSYVEVYEIHSVRAFNESCSSFAHLVVDGGRHELGGGGGPAQVVHVILRRPQEAHPHHLLGLAREAPVWPNFQSQFLVEGCRMDRKGGHRA